MFKLRSFSSVLILMVLISACASIEVSGYSPKEPTATRTVDTTSNPASSNYSRDTCQVTRPPEPPFAPPGRFPPSAPQGTFWFGTNDLWTAVPMDGIWAGLPKNSQVNSSDQSKGHTPGYTQKVFWWREGYSSELEPEPQLAVTIKRPDGPSEPLQAGPATNASAEDIGSAMLVGVEFPEAGCWEITGRYNKARLSFVVWIEP